MLTRRSVVVSTQAARLSHEGVRRTSMLYFAGHSNGCSLENIYSRHQDLREPHCSLCRLLFFRRDNCQGEVPDSCHTLTFNSPFDANASLCPVV